MLRIWTQEKLLTLMTAELAANHPTWSIQQIADECARRGSPHVTKWSISRMLARSEYFKCLPRKLLLMTEEHQRKSQDWRITYHEYNFDIVIFTEKN